ncbi:ribosomal protein S18 acetylase RimI-like enzyme [Neobacillus bataviensis]|uniref:Ribosomal protein S18 acetylase RimI-like enzyme n=1 Tax=Neobacillus bataviensis TaxID=220685 RepID=A0A561CZ69_9BACI|nr:GNAT family N-acetyltransferase [Neobacillus bataviensis]TWD96360.1 ribosomal protein S18 acetylase RimI-like enzyme [Neobacillus bataviensis]
MAQIRMVKKEDLADLVVLENRCFLKEEAATEEAFKKRIETISDSFFVAEVEGVIMGLINGPVIETPYITDDLFSEIKVNPRTGGHQSVLGLAVSPEYQNQGIAGALLANLEKDAKEKHRETVTLTCKKDLVGFYETHGYVNQGVSSSEHGGVTWYNMVKPLK